MNARWRVVRQASHGTGTDVCRHRSQRLAYWCARRNLSTAPTGVWFDVRREVTE